MANYKSTARKKRHISRSALIIASWSIAALVGIALHLGWMPALDLPMLRWVQNNSAPGLQHFMYIITLLGSWPAYVIILIVLGLFLMFKKQLHVWLVLTLNTVCTLGMCELLKAIFQRERPLDFFQIAQGGYSYPSGHAMVAVAFYFLVALALCRTFPKLKALASVLAAASFLPGLSRIFMGVHYPSDVIMGWLLGLSAALFWNRIWQGVEGKNFC